MPIIDIHFVTKELNNITVALDSLLETTTCDIQVYVTIYDPNPPESIKLLPERYQGVIFWFQPKLYPYVINHNRAMEKFTSRYFAILNDDVRLENNVIDQIVAYLEKNPGVGMASPQLLNEDGSFQNSVYSDPSLARMLYRISGLASLTNQDSRLRQWLLKMGIGRLISVESIQPVPEAPKYVPVIKGTFLIVRRETYQKIGGLDEALFYVSDPDWCYRARQAGWKVALVPSARVTHYGRGQTSLKLPAKHLVEDRKAILHYFNKHRPAWQVAVLRAAMVGFHSLWTVCWLPFSRERAAGHWRVVLVGVSGKN